MPDIGIPRAKASDRLHQADNGAFGNLAEISQGLCGRGYRERVVTYLDLFDRERQDIFYRRTFGEAREDIGPQSLCLNRTSSRINWRCLVQERGKLTSAFRPSAQIIDMRSDRNKIDLRFHFSPCFRRSRNRDAAALRLPEDA